MDELFKNITYEDIEKLQMFISMFSKRSAIKQITLESFKREYLELIKKRGSHNYCHSVESSFKHLIEFFGPLKDINSIGVREVEKFTAHLQQKVKKGYCVYFKTLKAAFNKCAEWGYIRENYFLKIKLPGRQKLAPQFLNQLQLGEICSRIKNEIVKNVVWFAFYTGLRLDEIVNLKWKNIDLKRGIITVGDEEFITKGRKQRFIPLCNEAANLLENEERRIKSNNGKYALSSAKENKFNNCYRILKKREYVFCKSNGKRFTGDYFSKRFKEGSIAAGMDKGIHFHTLRHSFASNLVQKGVPLYTVKELLGHASISTTEIYSHLNMDTLREAVEKLGARSERQGILETEDRRSETGKNSAKIFRIECGELK